LYNNNHYLSSTFFNLDAIKKLLVAQTEKVMRFVFTQLMHAIIKQNSLVGGDLLDYRVH